MSGAVLGFIYKMVNKVWSSHSMDGDRHKTDSHVSEQGLVAILVAWLRKPTLWKR